MEHARFFFNELGKMRVDRLRKSEVQYRIFEAILDNPGINQAELSKLVDRQQANVSRITRELEADGYISIKKVSRTNYYYAEPKFQLGFSDTY